MELCSGAEGDTDQAVEAYLKGELVSTGANCDHHHGEGTAVETMRKATPVEIMKRAIPAEAAVGAAAAEDAAHSRH